MRKKYVDVMKYEDKLWYKDAVIYEVHVKSFYDSNSDGIGDFKGLIEKLDYIQFLGADTIWLLPFYPSPLKDDGYDIADYYNVNELYGNLKDFKLFLREAHRRKLHVMTELVINHTSNMHAWFQRARTSKPNSKWRNFYVWSDSPDKFQDARIIFKDFETSNWSFDPVANSYYWHRFYSHQPDLNFDNPHVHEAIIKILDFWLSLGIDGLRLDAIPYLYERENSTCENLNETHQFLKKLRKHVDEKYENRFLLAEANQWPDDAVAYFGEGDECHMAFHFPMMPRMYTAIEMEDRFPLIDILKQTPDIPNSCQWVSFLRNHDELTLEMVTDEERDYMYRTFAHDPQMRINLGIRRRLAPLMGNDRRKIELMNAILFTLPGTPVIYYGDEIGMGDNIYLGDRNSVRTPMQWNGDTNGGFSNATPQKLYLPLIIDPEYNYSAINVSLQKHNNQSLLWWMKRVIAMRKRFKAFGRGTIEFILPENNKVIVFVRRYENDIILVAANLSRYSQFVELDLSEFQSKIPVELFGDTNFKAITDKSYALTFTPYAFFCFKLNEANIDPSQDEIHKITSIKYIRNLQDLLHKDHINELEIVLANYLPSCKWFPAKNNKIYGVEISDYFYLHKNPSTILLQIKAKFKDKQENYLLFISDANKNMMESIKNLSPHALIAEFNHSEDSTGIIDSIYHPEICLQILTLFKKKRQLKGYHAELFIKPNEHLRNILKEKINPDHIQPIRGEQSNTSIILDNKMIMKIFRRIDFGINPEIEISEKLTNIGFKNTPRILSTLELKMKNNVMSLALLEEFILHQSTAWEFTLNSIKIFFDQALAKHTNISMIQVPEIFLTQLSDIPTEALELLGPFASSVELLGLRTGELHAALSRIIQENFIPERFSAFDQRALYQSIQSLCRRSFEKLKSKLPSFPEGIQTEIKKLLSNQPLILNLAKEVMTKKNSGKKIRCHGDYHLGQVLYTGKDFIIIDFEGEPDRSLSERRIKRSPLKDVAGMLRSYHYAVYTVMHELNERLPEQENLVKHWGNYWYRYICQLFLKSYIKAIHSSDVVPESEEIFLLFLKFYMLEKAIYEMEYELNHRPNWLSIPCVGILELIGKNA